ncbi:YPT35 [Candida margitis]|uniref:YPT35 n=1 Tax=Candida margitis TaxID=1775924 RepID=UPI0022273DFA|nr:YPT35 [Candida margitis]KAI5967921.1 YPT35 [Candida margitis]
MSRKKSNSVTQLNNVLPIPIELNSGEDLQTHQRNHQSHITDVRVGEHHLVQGNTTSSVSSSQPQKYIVWQIKITINDLGYSSIVIYKRYRELLQLYNDLQQYYKGQSDIVIPRFPPKDSFSFERLVMSRNWLEDRRKGLQWFLSSVLLDPVLQKGPVVKQFVLGN